MFVFHLFLKTEAEKSEDSSGSAGLSSLHRTYSQDCSFKNSMYHVGDYVYVEPAEANLQPHIVCIERLWEDSAGKDAFHTERQYSEAYYYFHLQILAFSLLTIELAEMF